MAFGLCTAFSSVEERAALADFLTGVHPDETSSDRLSSIATPSDLDKSWEFLGYDIADLAGTSGLMNMGFLTGVDEVAALRARWGMHLNTSHLFVDRSRAEEFKSFSSQRVPEHAPFYVIGLWLVKRRGAGLPTPGD